jgi:hypothetical protein
MKQSIRGTVNYENKINIGGGGVWRFGVLRGVYRNQKIRGNFQGNVGGSNIDLF